MIYLLLALLLAAAWKYKHPAIVLTDPATGRLYLTRWTLYRTKRHRIFLHRMSGPDLDRHLHHHPWKAMALILRGGYIERVHTPGTGYHGTHQHRTGDLNQLDWSGYHKIHALTSDTTWTLLFAGAKERSWGFLVDGRHVDYRTYLGLPADHELED